MSTDSNNTQTGQPCANPDCTFTGHAGFENYCSVCYKEHVNAKANAKPTSTKMEVEEEEMEAKVSSAADEAKEVSSSEAPNDEDKPVKKVQKNRKRCFECRKKVGILGFECRCGFVYCGSHRFPEDHQCEFDHAAFDKARLAKSTQKAEAKKVDVL